MYLVLAESRFDNKVQFLVAPSLSQARRQLPRFSDATGYMTLWYPRWATKHDVKMYAGKLRNSNLTGYEFKKLEEVQ